MPQPKDSPEYSEAELQIINQVIALRNGAVKQIWLGLAWWTASAIAVAVSLGMSGGSVIWFGGGGGGYWLLFFTGIEHAECIN